MASVFSGRLRGLNMEYTLCAWNLPLITTSFTAAGWRQKPSAKPDGQRTG